MTSAVDFGDYELYANGVPYDLFAKLRREAPVLWVAEPARGKFPGGTGYWAVFRHTDVQTVSRHPEIFSSAIGGTTLRDLRHKDLEIVRHMMLNMDPPRHSKLRKIVNRVFTPQVIGQLKGSIEDHAREVVDSIAEKGSVDFLEEVAAEMPLLVLADIFGFPSEDRHLLHRWTDTMIAYDDPDAGPAEAAAIIATVKEMFGYASGKTAEKRVKPTNDVWSLIANAEVDGEQLSQGQLDRFFQLLVIAGNETTRSLISSGMQLLSQHPDQRDMLLKDMSLLPAAIEEMLRFAPPVIQFRRTAAVDTMLGGRGIAKGDKVVIFYASANRDETAFEQPDKFDIRRNPNPHVSFGDGTHFCLGANLARLEARVIFTELLTRLPDLEITGTPERLRSNFVTNFKHMSAQFTPAARRAPADIRAKALAPSESVATPAAAKPAALGKHGTPLLVLFGSNFGTAEDTARRIASDADAHGFATTVAPLDDHVGDLASEGAVIIVAATYNGTPPDNATHFMEWLRTDDGEPLTGVRYAVFGCGNHDWAATFQEVPRTIDTLLEKRGARRLYSRGEGDAADDFDGQFEAWYKPLWPALAAEFSIGLEALVSGPMFAIEVVPGERMSPFVASLGARPMRIAVHRELQSMAGPDPSAASTRHVELELPDGVAYRPGDHLGVIPHNSDGLVRRVAARFGFEKDAFIRLHARSERRTFLPIGERISVHSLLADYVELQDLASRSHIRTLANYTECPFTKTALEGLAAENGSTYRDEVLLKRKSVIDLLEQYPACKLPLEIYLEMLSPLAPRYYSISSSPLASNGRCSITVGVVRGPARAGVGSFTGVCSNYVSRQAEGNVVYAFVKDTKSAFYLPEDPRTPLIMIGPGTGLAPFRGFLQQRAAMKERGIAVGASLLFFGCRHEKQDFLYADELREFASQGVTELHIAFSRMQPEKVYVQDHIRRAKDRVWALIDNGAIIYVCGDASRMEPDVRKVLVGVIEEKLGVDAAAAGKRFDQLVAENRYLVDVWATG
ncbi:cytochrome P450 [Bradyrhizobium sp. AZCC 1693]|uniref:cytochrome P450 n=1 Tax=Bradyrhizobium sp. AZCC 1693 TaxID=3117029 RepID=UPI002FF263D0